jgi:pimeloyl-ACP methyl ester carboxylesterase
MVAIETKHLTLAPDMVFDVSVGGSPDTPLVLMLHGFGVSRFSYSGQVAALADAGFFAAAPNQRGYAAGARPDPSDFSNYKIDLLIADVLGIVSALGHGERPFHLVGHDWGGSLAWAISDRYPERLGSLTILSRPHPASFNRALTEDPGQSGRSAHHSRFLEPNAAHDILADDVKWLRTRLTANGVPAAQIEKHLAVLGTLPAMEAALAWYRARGVRHAPAEKTQVPTLYIWGDADDTVGRMAAEGTGEFISAPYKFIELPGVGHYAADQRSNDVSALLLAHLHEHPISGA